MAILLTMAILTVTMLAMAILTVAILTMAILTVAILTMAILTMAILTMAILTMVARLYESMTQKWRGPGLTMSRGLGDTDAAECLPEESLTN